MKGIIKYWRCSRSVSELLDMIEHNELTLLENNCLSEDKKSLYIESLLLGFPVKKIITLIIDSNTTKVLSGYLELNTIKSFLNNEFKLTGVLNKELLNVSCRNVVGGVNVAIKGAIKRNSLLVGEIEQSSLKIYSEEFFIKYCNEVIG